MNAWFHYFRSNGYSFHFIPQITIMTYADQWYDMTWKRTFFASIVFLYWRIFEMCISYEYEKANGN